MLSFLFGQLYMTPFIIVIVWVATIMLIILPYSCLKFPHIYQDVCIIRSFVIKL